MTPSTHLASEASALVRKLWQYCNVLRDDGLSYPDYVEQLTYLLFLKMSDEKKGSSIPLRYSWRSFAGLKAEAMHQHYGRVLAALGKGGGMLSLIFQDAKNKIRDPGKLRLLVVDLIGQTDWTELSIDVKGEAYEGLLEKNARDTKSGAGQYFTPRPLIDAIVECIDPRPGEVIYDPACGTGGFLLAAHTYLRKRSARMNESRRRHVTTSGIRGVELVQEVARLATMNLMLHGISGDSDDQFPIVCADSLREPPRRKVDVVLTNPPFGVKGSVTYSKERKVHGQDELTVIRPDFVVQTANKQLNFLQHVCSLLKPTGRAAIVIPDNSLFEGGAAAAVRRRMLETFDVHTLLRLPAGLFYAQGVKANVLFFDCAARQNTNTSPARIWVYDLRSDSRFSLKTNPLGRENLEEFVRFYRMVPREENHVAEQSFVSSRWRSFDRGRILASEDCSLDLSWGKENGRAEAPSLSRLDEISRLIAEDLQRALRHVSNIGVGPVDRNASRTHPGEIDK